MSGGWETPSVWPDDVFDKTNYLCDKVGSYHAVKSAMIMNVFVVLS